MRVLLPTPLLMVVKREAWNPACLFVLFLFLKNRGHISKKTRSLAGDDWNYEDANSAPNEHELGGLQVLPPGDLPPEAEAALDAHERSDDLPEVPSQCEGPRDLPAVEMEISWEEELFGVKFEPPFECEPMEERLHLEPEPVLEESEPELKGLTLEPVLEEAEPELKGPTLEHVLEAAAPELLEPVLEGPEFVEESDEYEAVLEDKSPLPSEAAPLEETLGFVYLNSVPWNLRNGNSENVF